MTAQKGRVADILAVDFEAEAGRQENAKRGEYAQNLISVREFLEIDRQADVVAVFCGDALDDGADFVAGTWRRRLADDLPVAVLRAYFAVAGLRARPAGARWKTPKLPRINRYDARLTPRIPS